MLKQIAELIQHTMGKERQLFRIGGEEFLILFPDLCAEEAFSATERIRLRTASSLLVSGRPITFSAGIASYPLHAESTASLLHVADEALYVSKTKGRNRTTLYTHKELE